MNGRLVATHYLALLSPQLYLPGIWEFKDFWHSRIIYTALRDAMEVEKLMGICMSWSSAREYAFLCVTLSPCAHVLCSSTRTVVYRVYPHGGRLNTTASRSCHSARDQSHHDFLLTSQLRFTQSNTIRSGTMHVPPLTQTIISPTMPLFAHPPLRDPTRRQYCVFHHTDTSARCPCTLAWSADSTILAQQSVWGPANGSRTVPS